MWLAFRFVFGAVLGYVFALVFLIAIVIGATVFLTPSPQQQHPYHTTKATRS
jgi:integral membrane sensor domain MASE1